MRTVDTSARQYRGTRLAVFLAATLRKAGTEENGRSWRVHPLTIFFSLYFSLIFAFLFVLFFRFSRVRLFLSIYLPFFVPFEASGGLR